MNSRVELWSGDLEASDEIVAECLKHIDKIGDKCVMLQRRSRNYWLRGCFREAFNDTLLALKILGVDLNPVPTRQKTDTMFEQIRNEILSIGFDEILSIPRSSDPKIELAVALLNDAGIYSPCLIIFLILTRSRHQRSPEPRIYSTNGHDWTYGSVSSFIFPFGLTAIYSASNWHYGRCLSVSTLISQNNLPCKQWHVCGYSTRFLLDFTSHSRAQRFVSFRCWLRETGLANRRKIRVHVREMVWLSSWPRNCSFNPP